MFRIFQAVELREQTVYLSSAFAYYLLVAAIPLLSCLRVPALQKDANCSLNSLETSLRTLGAVRPAAANNLKSVRAIRKALATADTRLANVDGPTSRAEPRSSDEAASPMNLFTSYSPASVEHYQRVVDVLNVDYSSRAASGSHPEVTPGRVTVGNDGEHGSYADELALADGCADPFVDFLQADLLADNFWMRDWMDELQPGLMRGA